MCELTFAYYPHTMLADFLLVVHNNLKVLT